MESGAFTALIKRAHKKNHLRENGINFHETIILLWVTQITNRSLIETGSQNVFSANSGKVLHSVLAEFQKAL